MASKVLIERWLNSTFLKTIIYTNEITLSDMRVN